MFQKEKYLLTRECLVGEDTCIFEYIIPEKSLSTGSWFEWYVKQHLATFATCRFMMEILIQWDSYLSHSKGRIPRASGQLLQQCPTNRGNDGKINNSVWHYQTKPWLAERYDTIGTTVEERRGHFS
jgi:hypothetical protein